MSALNHGANSFRVGDVGKWVRIEQDEIIVPDAATMAAWREGLRPVTERTLADLAAHGFPNARAAYEKVAAALRH